MKADKHIGVRQLAERLCRTGDLYTRNEAKPVDAELGIETQRAVQRMRARDIEDYQRELSLAATLIIDGVDTTLSGRVDGSYTTATDVCLEEFKACRTLPDTAGAIDLGQLRIYAGLYAHSEDRTDTDLILRLVYVRVETLEERVFEHRINQSLARLWLQFMSACFDARIKRHHARLEPRRDWAQDKAFPFAAFRKSQQAMARRVYVALDNAENLLLEAPTGSGKSMGVLFPTVKYIAREQVFFLTSRSLGARAALAACRQLDRDSAHLSTVQITAKEKTCFVEGMPCDPDRCEYARGYFDRVPLAVDAVLDAKLAERDTIEAIAREYTVCPFELSLDAAWWADIIVCDYNYVFDPVVRLRRFEGNPDLILLVDEAHQLAPRVASMLSVSIDRDEVALARKVAHTAISKRAASIDRALLKLRREHGDGERLVHEVGAVERALARFVDTVGALDVDVQGFPEIVPLFFACTAWQKSLRWTKAECYVCIVHVQGREVKVSRQCVDPSAYTGERLAEFKAAVRFSGTLSPLPLYQMLHGADGREGGSIARVGSPFSAEQLAVLIVRDIPTYYRQRERSLRPLSHLIEGVLQVKAGRYIVALPSYEYLHALVKELETGRAATQGEGGDCLSILRQVPGQSEPDAQALLAEFQALEHGVLFMVMGGIFGESVDFSTLALSGVILIGLGLPPPSAYRDAQAARYDAAAGAGVGELVAYTQPALVKVVQAAGRLLRSPQDRGVVCLVDPRFTDSRFVDFFPDIWRPEVVSAKQVVPRVEQFWTSAGRTPRLPPQNDHA